jgi:CrcB protein
MSNVFFIFIGGGIGSVLRYLISKSISSNFTQINPFATLTSNLLATLLLAYLMYYIQDKSEGLTNHN